MLRRIGFVIVVGLAAVASRGAEPGAVAPPATLVPDETYRAAVGDLLTIYCREGGTLKPAPAAYSEAGFTDLQRTIMARDETGLKELMARKDITSLESGTRVRVLAVEESTIRQRQLRPTSTDRLGYVSVAVGDDPMRRYLTVRVEKPAPGPPVSEPRGRS